MTTLVVLGMVLVVSACDSTPQADPDSPSAAGTATTGDEGTTPSGPGRRVTVVEGHDPDGDRTWKVRAQMTDDGLCLEYGGPALTSTRCSPQTHGTDGELVVVGAGTSSGDGATEGCLAGAVDSQATVVEAEFTDGQVHTTQPQASSEFDELAFFGHCWTGDQRLERVISADGSGQHMDEETVSVPATPEPEDSYSP